MGVFELGKKIKILTAKLTKLAKNSERQGSIGFYQSSFLYYLADLASLAVKIA